MKPYQWNQIVKEQLSPLVARQVIHGKKLTIARLFLNKGAIVAEHSHINEQLTMLEKGRLRFTIDGERLELVEGQILLIPANAAHGVEAMEDSIAMDMFSPAREDWIRGEDAYLRK